MRKRPPLYTLQLLSFLITLLPTCAAMSFKPKPIQMAHIQNNPTSSSSPPTLFLHGLDSSSHTWRDVLTELQTPAVAVDLRGCGSSPSGDCYEDDFSCEALVEDVHHFVTSHSFLKERGPFVLVGHSMGGRIAAAYAATYPSHVSSLIIEDMDMKRRSVNPVPITLSQTFERGGKTKEELVQRLQKAGYPTERVEKWVAEGRISQKGEEWWSDVNPLFRVLCYQHIFDNDSGTTTWDILASSKIPCHVMVADEKYTVCDEDTIQDMVKRMERCKVLRYPNGYHSIHNSKRDEFMKDLRRIISTC
mmetsp:Transcript_13168/g.17639  ORF Transcript_13168/g.17639 Transcript_13168/m.17639 type:complete len:304 (-) Transcript_13168:137-1048(-)